MKMNEVIEKTLIRTREEIAMYSSIVDILEKMPGDMNYLTVPTLKNMIQQGQEIIDCVENGKPFAASAYTNPSEILAAMDLPWYFIFKQAFSGGLPNPHIAEDLEAIDSMPIASEECSLTRLGLHYLNAGLLPRPTVYLGVTSPCDNVVGSHEAIRTHAMWKDVPSWAPDTLYWSDEESIKYFAEELKEMVRFTTQHTGKKLDIDRLREIVEETNKQYVLWQEYSDLKRAVPTPHSYNMSLQCFWQTNSSGVGKPEFTQWFRDLVADAEKRVQEKRPELSGQKIRCLWFDIPPLCIQDLFGWMQQEWGATVVMDMISYCPYTSIDTKNEDTIFYGLAKRALIDPPMIRQARGLVQNFLTDIERIVTDYKIDRVIWPGHVGHKDGAASASLMREKCRELGVPLMHIGMDSFDLRNTSLEEIKNKVSQFFMSTGLGSK
jgi:benzoyl-CoA reductase/2-hydroxyglutaryl-CoA dehydratase subunit BcrC/BadD/HgdB